jgi:hypothetical protein
MPTKVPITNMSANALASPSNTAPSSSRMMEARSRPSSKASSAPVEGIVDRLLFDAAQTIIRDRSLRLSDDQMLETLRTLLASRGYLSGIVIDEADQSPSSSAYQSRFGSLLRAYQLVGFTPDRDFRYIEINRVLRSP